MVEIERTGSRFEVCKRGHGSGEMGPGVRWKAEDAEDVEIPEGSS